MDTEAGEESWVSVTGVYNWLDCRVLIWFSFCLPSEEGCVQAGAQEGRENARNATCFPRSFPLFI